MSGRKRSQVPEISVLAALGQQLKLSRIAAQYPTQVALADKLYVDATLIAKAETGARPPTEPLFKKWLDECAVGGQLRSALEALWILARLHVDPLTRQTVSWVEAEAEAHTLRYWNPLLVPGLVQIADYARTLFVAWGHDQDRVEELVQERMARRSILDRANPPDVAIIVWETSLYICTGSAEIMRDQLSFLLELSERPFINVQVLPSSVGTHMGFGGQISLAATNEAEMLLMEGFSDSIVTSDRAQVRRASTTFNSVRADVLPQAASRATLLEAIETWNATTHGASPRSAHLGETTAV